MQGASTSLQKTTAIIEIILPESLARKCACMMAKGIMDFYPGRQSYITTANFGQVDVHLPKPRKKADATKAPVEIVPIKEMCYL